MLEKLIDRLRKGPKFRYKSAETGLYVTKLYAMIHPATTYREQVR